MDAMVGWNQVSDGGKSAIYEDAVRKPIAVNLQKYSDLAARGTKTLANCTAN